MSYEKMKLAFLTFTFTPRVSASVVDLESLGLRGSGCFQRYSKSRFVAIDGIASHFERLL
jgi:hypothetical protein